MSTALTDLLWHKANEGLLFISKETFVKNLEGWDIKPLVIGGQTAFVILTKGPEFHFQSMGTGAIISMKMIRECLQKIIDEHGCVTTRTPKTDVRQYRVNLALGFQVTGEDEYDRHFRMEKLRNV